MNTFSALRLGAVLLASTLLACGDSGTSSGGSGGAGGEASGANGSGAGDAGAAGGAGAGSEGGGGGGTNSAEPARYALELVSPREAGTAPASDASGHAMPSGHRSFKAYPGIEYNVRAVVIGGSFPYRFSLANAPAGMTVDERTGEISWPDPSANATPTLTVRDAEGTEISEPWTIQVGTSGFRFVDAVTGNDGNAGTLASPWRTLAGLRENGAAGEIVYFRAGTYTTDNMPLSGSDTWVRVEMNGVVHPVQWIAYPGETPVIDNGYVGAGETGQFLRLSGSDTHPVYLDGFEILGAWDKGLQFGSGTDYATFRRLSIHDVAEAIDGANSAGIMALSSYGDPSWYAAYQDCDFFDNAPGGIKLYSHKKVLWEDLSFRDSGGGPDLKSHVPRFEVRGSSFTNMSGPYCGLFGNMNFGGGSEGEAASGEVRYNFMSCGDAPDVYAMDVNQDGMAAQVDLYRNTFVGTVRVRNTDSADGMFHFDANVIVNSNEGTDHVSLEAVSDPSRVSYVDNLSGAPSEGIVDASGALTPAFAEWLGLRGHVIPD